MKNVNWRVRFRNERFWLTFIPAFILLIQALLAVFNVTVDMSEIQMKILTVVDALFVVLAILGVVNDPTTEGFSDSELAKTYDEPKPKG